MSFSRYYDINARISSGPAGPLIKRLAGIQPADSVEWVARDKFKVRIRFGKDGDTDVSALTALQLDAGAQIILSGRPSNNLTLADPLFLCIDFTEVHSGDDWYYEALLSLDNAPLIAAVSATAQGSLNVTANLKVLSADGTEIFTIPQFSVVLRASAYNPTDGVPAENVDLKASQAQAESGTSNTNWMTPLRTLQSLVSRLGTVITAAVTSGQATVDFDITSLGLAAAPTFCVPLGLQKPGDAADNIGILAAFPVSATTLRAYLTAAPSVSGYQAAILFR